MRLDRAVGASMNQFRSPLTSGVLLRCGLVADAASLVEGATAAPAVDQATLRAINADPQLRSIYEQVQAMQRANTGVAQDPRGRVGAPPAWRQPPNAGTAEDVKR